MPGHSFKFAAALQAAQGGDAPILIRVETSAGHGAGKPTAKLIAESTDMLDVLGGGPRAGRPLTMQPAPGTPAAVGWPQWTTPFRPGTVSC